MTIEYYEGHQLFKRFKWGDFLNTEELMDLRSFLEGLNYEMGDKGVSLISQEIFKRGLHEYIDKISDMIEARSKL